MRGECTFWLVSEFDCEEVVDFVVCDFGCGDCVRDVVVAAIETFKMSIQI